MNNCQAAKIRMMAAEGKLIRQIAAAISVSDEEVEKVSAFGGNPSDVHR